MLVYHPSVIFSYGIFQARMVGNVIPGTDLNSDMSIKRTLFPPIETFHACFFFDNGGGVANAERWPYGKILDGCSPTPPISVV